MVPDYGVPGTGRILVQEHVDKLKGVIDGSLGLEFKEFMCHGRLPAFFGNVRHRTTIRSRLPADSIVLYRVCGL
jgi:hypothetical protein